jgi:tripartite-type tricarboxylate transporter receptor subunit TctC
VTADAAPHDNPDESLDDAARANAPMTTLRRRNMTGLIARCLAPLALLAVSTGALAQACPERNVMYWQAFPPGGESDLSARHQQAVLKKKCPAIDTIIQYKPGAGGGLMWAQINQQPADGVNVIGINLPHIVFQPIEGQVQYKTEDIVPVYWFHYTPDALVVPESSAIKSFADFVKAAKAEPGKLTLGGSGLNSANHAAHERMNAAFGVKTTYVPFKGTGDMTTAVFGSHVSGAMTYTAFAVNNKGKVRALAVAMEKRHPLMPDVPTFKELGVDWVDGAYRGIGMPKATPLVLRKRMSDLWAALNNDPEMKELAARSGFELVNVGVDGMDAFMKEKVKLYTEGAKRMGLTSKQ